MNKRGIFYFGVVLLWLLYVVIAWYGDMRTCEDNGGEYLKGFMSWKCVQVLNCK